MIKLQVEEKEALELLLDIRKEKHCSGCGNTVGAIEEILTHLKAAQELVEGVRAMDLVDLNDGLAGSKSWGAANSYWKDKRDTILKAYDNSIK